MNAIELSIVIKRPIEESFAFLTDLENDVKWHTAFVEVRRMSGNSLGVGARFLVFEGVLGRRTPGIEYEVAEYEPTRIAAWKTSRDLSGKNSGGHLSASKVAPDSPSDMRGSHVAFLNWLGRLLLGWSSDSREAICASSRN